MYTLETNPICIASPLFKANAERWDGARTNICRPCEGYGCDLCNTCSRCATCASLFSTNIAKKPSYVTSNANVVNLTSANIFTKPSLDPDSRHRVKASAVKKINNTVVLGNAINHSDDTKCIAMHLANQVNLMTESFETLVKLKTSGETVASPYLQLYLEMGNPREKAEFVEDYKVTHPHSWILHRWDDYVDSESFRYNRSDYFGDDLSFIAYVVAEGSRVYSTRFGKKVWAKIYIDYNAIGNEGGMSPISHAQIDVE